MKRWLLILILYQLCMCIACSEDEKEFFERQDISLLSRSFLDSIQVPCFVNDEFAGAMNEALKIIGDSILIDFCCNSSYLFFENVKGEESKYPVLAEIYKFSSGKYQILIIINSDALSTYTYRGQLLVALHELYHIYLTITMGETDNEWGHYWMVYGGVYTRWLERAFNCGSDAKYLAYIGTSVYQTSDVKNKVHKMWDKYNLK